MAWPETESEVCSLENAPCRTNSQYAAIVAVGASSGTSYEEAAFKSKGAEIQMVEENTQSTRNATPGRILAAEPARQIQFGLKFVF